MRTPSEVAAMVELGSGSFTYSVVEQWEEPP